MKLKKLLSTDCLPANAFRFLGLQEALPCSLGDPLSDGVSPSHRTFARLWQGIFSLSLSFARSMKLKKLLKKLLEKERK